MPHPWPMTRNSRLCVHTITTKPWPIEVAMDRYAAAGIGGITVWRQALEGRNIARVGDDLRARNLEIVSLCRGGFFPNKTAEGRAEAIEENRRAIREAAELGAPLVVLVCGAVPGQPLAESRRQIADGIAAVLPLAEELNVRLGIEPLHPMYADDRSAINTMASANAVCDELDHPLVGLAVDAYHVWWDPDLAAQIALTGEKNRLFAFHICDWLTPTTDLLNDRGLMGEGCIDLKGMRAMVESAGFSGYHEVEIFSNRWWSVDQDEFLARIQQAYTEHR
jgi:sugar phosphate isomerase/epimerase